MNMTSIQIYQFCQKRYVTNSSVGIHTHNYFHLIFVERGLVNIYISDNKSNNQSCYKLSSGDIHIAPWGLAHSIVPVNDRELRTLELKFIPTDRDFADLLAKLPHIIHQVPKEVITIINKIIAESVYKDILYKELISCKFVEALVCMLRQTGKKKDEKRIDNEKFYRLYCMEPLEWLGITTRYIRDNLDKKLKAKTIASLCGFSESYFCTLFKRSLGITLGQYCNNLRYFKAIDLMENTELNMTQIAESLGFSSIHYFSRFFKKMSGFSPTEYTKIAKTDYTIKLLDLDGEHSGVCKAYTTNVSNHAG